MKAMLLATALAAMLLAPLATCQEAGVQPESPVDVVSYASWSLFDIGDRIDTGVKSGDGYLETYWLPDGMLGRMYGVDADGTPTEVLDEGYSMAGVLRLEWGDYSGRVEVAVLNGAEWKTYLVGTTGLQMGTTAGSASVSGEAAQGRNKPHTPLFCNNSNGCRVKLWKTIPDPPYMVEIKPDVKLKNGETFLVEAGFMAQCDCGVPPS